VVGIMGHSAPGKIGTSTPFTRQIASATFARSSASPLTVVIPSSRHSGFSSKYARQAALVSKDTLMVNPVADDPVNHGGSFRFENGSVTERIPFDTEGILIVAVD